MSHRRVDGRGRYGNEEPMREERAASPSKG